MILIFFETLHVFFCKKKIYNFSTTLTVIFAVVGDIDRDVYISFYQFKSTGFSHSLLRMQNIK